jgi:fumarate reductase flavoprotein subunit
VLLRTLEANLVKRGGAVQRGTRVTGLVMADGRCVGVEAEQGGKPVRIDAGAVVLCDGGFSGNVEAIRRWITPRADRLLIRSTPSEGGDGLLMAEAAGVTLTGFGPFYGHPMHRDAVKNPKLWPFPMMDPLCQAAIVVDGQGRRFADEGRGGIVMANEIARLDDPLTATVVFDEAIWTSAGKEVGGPNPLLSIAGGGVHKADSLATLAGLAGLPPDTLAATVAAYNAAVAGGTAAALDPPRSGVPVAPMPIAKPPFYAAPLVSGITATMGGVPIDAGARALRADGQPIAGLYAAGTTVAGLEREAAAYVGGLSKAFILGLLAAEAIAADLGRAAA